MSESQHRRLLLLGSLAALTLAAACHRPPPPHVLLITIDTLRNDHCSVAGYGRPTTPHLEQLARHGARMALTYAPTSTTGPTHASIFTSLYPIAHGVIKNGLELAPSFVTLAETLGQHGYDTAGVVSSFVLDTKFGYSQGFGFYDDDFDAEDTSLPRKRFEGHEIEGGFDQRSAATTDKALEQLERLARGGRPFFLFVHYFDPHAPYDPPEPWTGRFASGAEDELAREIDAYDAEIAYADHGVGQLLERLGALGLEDETLVIVTADHGEGLMQHDHMHHGVNIYEETVRVPLIFRFPGWIEADRVYAEPVELLDLFPTVLDLAGVAAPAGLHGRSLVAALTGSAGLDPRRPVHLHRRHYRTQVIDRTPVSGERFGVRLGSWKYIEGDEDGKRELYDLESDPGELSSVEAAHPDVVQELSERIAAWKLARGADRPVQELAPEDVQRLRDLGYVE